MIVDLYKVTEKPKKKEKIKSLVEKLEELEPKKQAKQILEWISSFDVAKIKSYEDIAKGYRGIFALCLHFGHADQGIRRQCEVLIKCMQGVTNAYEKHLALEFPEQIRAEIDREMELLFNALEKTLSKEEVAKIRETFKACQ